MSLKALHHQEHLHEALGEPLKKVAFYVVTVSHSDEGCTLISSPSGAISGSEGS